MGKLNSTQEIIDAAGESLRLVNGILDVWDPAGGNSRLPEKLTRALDEAGMPEGRADTAGRAVGAYMHRIREHAEEVRSLVNDIAAQVSEAREHVKRRGRTESGFTV